MADERGDTKQALILAAGELFAERGFEGTSIRAIAEKAGANVAAISYHFGGKGDLYTRTLLDVVHSDTGRPVREFLERAEPQLGLEALRGGVLAIARRFFARLASAERPPWRVRLLLRAMFESEQGRLEEVIEESFRPDIADLMALARRVVPELSDRDAMLWAFGFMGQVAFYIFVREPVLRVLGKERYDQEFLDEAAEYVTTSAVASLAALRSE